MTDGDYIPGKARRDRNHSIYQPLSHRNRTTISVSKPLGDAIRRIARLEGRMTLDFVEELLRRGMASHVKSTVRKQEKEFIDRIRQQAKEEVNQSLHGMDLS